RPLDHRHQRCNAVQAAHCDGYAPENTGVIDYRQYQHQNSWNVPLILHGISPWEIFSALPFTFTKSTPTTVAYFCYITNPSRHTQVISQTQHIECSAFANH